MVTTYPYRNRCEVSAACFLKQFLIFYAEVEINHWFIEDGCCLAESPVPTFCVAIPTFCIAVPTKLVANKVRCKYFLKSFDCPGTVQYWLDSDGRLFVNCWRKTCEVSAASSHTPIILGWGWDPWERMLFDKLPSTNARLRASYGLQSMRGADPFNPPFDCHFFEEME